jgi:hypothetical protein
VDKKWEKDNCEAMRAHYAIYSIPKAAALWCGVPDDLTEKIVQEATQLSPSGFGRSVWKHPSVPCLEARSRAIAEACEAGELLHGRDDGKTVDSNDHVAWERRHFFGRELKKWMEKAFPNEKPAFLFDDIERNSHTAISADAYRVLKAEHDKLEKRLENTKSEFKNLRQEKEAIESERDSLKSIVDMLNKELQKYTSSKNDKSQLTDSSYWEKLLTMASNAVSEYPEWKKTQHQVQKTANLMDWLKNSIGADNREAEILKKVLSDFFNELR